MEELKAVRDALYGKIYKFPAYESQQDVLELTGNNLVPSNASFTQIFALFDDSISKLETKMEGVLDMRAARRNSTEEMEIAKAQIRELEAENKLAKNTISQQQQIIDALTAL